MKQLRIISDGKTVRILLPDGTDLAKFSTALEIKFDLASGVPVATLTFPMPILGMKAIGSDAQLAAIGLTFDDFKVD